MRWKRQLCLSLYIHRLLNAVQNICVFHLHSFLIMIIGARREPSGVRKTTEPDWDEGQPSPEAGLGGQTSIDVPRHVVGDQEEEGQEEEEDPDVPTVVISLQTF